MTLITYRNGRLQFRRPYLLLNHAQRVEANAMAQAVSESRLKKPMLTKPSISEQGNASVDSAHEKAEVQ